MESSSLPVLGMTCASCQHHVEEALRSTAGVESARVDLIGHRARVVFNPDVSSARSNWSMQFVARAMTPCFRAPAGFSHPPTRSTRPTPRRQSLRHARRRRIAMLLAMPLGSEMGAVDHALMRLLPWLYALPPDLLRWSLLILTAGIVVWAGRGIYLSAMRGLRHGTTNMNTLVSLGTGVAFAYSAYATVWPAPGRQVYFDAVLLIVGFLLLGKSTGGPRQTPRTGRARFALPPASRHRPAHSRWRRDGCAARRDSNRRQRSGAAR